MPPGNTTQTKTIIVRATSDGAKEINALAKQMGILNKNTAATANSLKKFGQVFQTVFAASVFGMGIAEVTGMIDSMQQLRDRLGNVTKEGDNVDDTFNQIVEAANRSRVSIDDFAASFTRMAMATQSTGLSTQSLLMVTEALQKTFLISGSSAKEAAASSIQLSQGLASGVLRGEEFNSVLEQNLYLGQALAKQITNGNVGALRALAKQGKLTNDQVLKALAKSMVDIEDKSNKMRLTIGQSVTIAFNGLLVVVDKLNEKLGLGVGIAKGIFFLADSLKYLGAIAAVVGLAKLPALLGSLEKFGKAIWTFAKANPLMLALTALAVLAVYVYDHFDLLKGEVLALGATFMEVGRSISENFMDPLRLFLAKLAGPDAVKNVQAYIAQNAKEGRAAIDDLNKRAAESFKKAEKTTVSFADRFASLMKDINNMNGTSMGVEQKPKEMLAELNKEYINLRISAAEYYEQQDKVGRRMATYDFAKGKDDLASFNEKLRQLSTANLNREFATGATSLEGYNMALDSLATNSAWDKLQSGKITLKEYNEELAKIPGQLNTIQSLTLGVQRYYDSIGTYANGIAKISETVLSSVEDEVVGWLTTGEATWEDFGKTVVNQIARIAYQMLIAKPIIESVMGLLSPGGGGVQTSGNSVGGASYMTNGYANGGVFNKSGVTAFANGGVVSSPTMFGMSGGGAGLMGEAGPEAIMPLRRGSNGELGVQATTAPVYVTINNNASGVEASQMESTGPNGERYLEITVQNIVSKGLAQGRFDKPLKDTYNIRRQGN